MNHESARSLEALAADLELLVARLRSVAIHLASEDSRTDRAASAGSLLSIREAVAQSGLSLYSIRQLIEAGALDVRRIGSRVFVTGQSLAKLSGVGSRSVVLRPIGSSSMFADS